MSICTLADLRTRLDDALSALPGETATPADTWDAFEMLCIAELDAMHDQFAPEILQDYMLVLLDWKRLTLGLEPFPESGCE